MMQDAEDKLAIAKTQGQAQFDSIKELVEALRASGEPASDEAMQAITEDALSVQVRSGWYTLGDNHNPRLADNCKPSEYNILLCTGGPACQLIGELDQYGQPETCRMEVQDWGTPWTAMRPLVSRSKLEGDDYDSEPVMLAYASCFYFGEG